MRTWQRLSSYLAARAKCPEDSAYRPVGGLLLHTMLGSEWFQKTCHRLDTKAVVTKNSELDVSWNFSGCKAKATR